MTTCTTHDLQQWIDLARDGDRGARDKLIALAGDRLRRLTHDMLRHDRVRRWEETDDVVQSAVIRLHADLEHLKLDTVRDYFGLAAFHIRRALIEFARHYYGPRGLGANYNSAHGGDTDGSGLWNDTPDGADSPSQVAVNSDRWRKLHMAIDELGLEEKEVVDFLWFHELSQSETASLLGVNVRTVQRRWQKARLQLYEALEEECLG